MKPLVHLAGVVLAVALAGLFSGCATTPHQAQRVEPVRDFEVVENSAQRPLTDQELAEVRASVASYLDRGGATDSGDYYLKVYLTPQNADGDPEWVVVRFTRYTAERVVLVGDYGYADAYYAPYYSYDLYPYGYYDGIARISFQYYVDPYYGHHYPYYPHHGAGGGHDDHHHDTANHHGGKPGNPPNNGNNQGSRPPPKYYGNRPGIPQNQNQTPPRTGATAQTDRRNDSPRQGGGRADGRTHSSAPANSDRHPVPPRPVQAVATDQNSRPAYAAPAGSGNPVRPAARVEPPSNRSTPVPRPAPSVPPVHASQPAPEHTSAASSPNGALHQEAAR